MVARENPLRIGTRTGRLEKERANKEHLDYSIIRIGQNTEENPGDLRKLAVTQTQVRNHSLTQVREALKGANRIIPHPRNFLMTIITTKMRILIQVYIYQPLCTGMM